MIHWFMLVVSLLTGEYRKWKLGENVEPGFSNARHAHRMHHVQDFRAEDPVINHAIRDVFHKILKLFIVSTSSTWSTAS